MQEVERAVEKLEGLEGVSDPVSHLLALAITSKIMSFCFLIRELTEVGVV